MQPLISLHNIVKKYKRHRALDGVDLDIHPGITGLLGPNGAGKSTLIKSILGLLRVSSGEGTVLGHRLGRGAKSIRNDLGYMPEDDCYIPGLAGIEVVQFAACLSGLPPVEAMRRSHEILDFCDMKQERYRNIETFSTGMRQKIKFAASIVHDPKFLILDEPTSGLDPEEREAFLRRVQLLCEQSGKSVLISTHILPDVQAICDQVVILSQGKIRLNKPLATLNAKVDPTVTVMVRQDTTEFVKQLEQHSLKVTPGAQGALVIEGESSDSLVKNIWQSAAQAAVVIDSLQPAMNSLETIFMNTVQEAASADS